MEIIPLGFQDNEEYQSNEQTDLTVELQHWHPRMNSPQCQELRGFHCPPELAAADTRQSVEASR